MNLRPLFRFLLALLLPAMAGLIPVAHAAPQDGRRLEILFLGDDGHHKPIGCYRVLKQVYGPRGFNLTFVEDLKQITTAKLNQYDVLIVYANHEEVPVPPAIRPWVENGGALVALHSAVGCFHPSQDWFSLVGGQFASHETGVFSPKTIEPNDPLMKGLPALNCWDETYVHKNTTNDRRILQVREPMNKGETQPEPWTWTRTQGKGRVFYTASGHDMRCWSQPAWQELVYRGILWAANNRANGWRALNLPALTLYTPEIPNRSHPDVPMMQLQKPLSPTDSAKHAQVPAGTHLELFAAEPLVINPIAIDWDWKNRCWVMEAMDYPNDAPGQGKGQDRLVILEDTNGDGKADKRTVFAEGLKLGTAFTFANGGVVTTDGEEIVFLKDDNGDDKADTRRVLATGLGISDTHACTSHFRYGDDNWIYATVGYSGIAVKTTDGKVHKNGSGVFRFKSDLSDLEVLQSTTNNTWGLGFTNAGDVMGSTANNNPSWNLSIPNRYYEAWGMKPPQTPRADTSTTIFPITTDFTQVDQIDRYTAGAGHDFYTDTLAGMNLDDHDALVCEPTAHIVGLGRIRPSGSLFATDFRGNNLYASADAWSAPVEARPGPDGAVWIADWYNPIIQHNVVFRFYNPARKYDQPHSPYQTGAPGPGKGNAYVTPLRDRQHGRIWRVVPDGGARKLATLDQTNPKDLLYTLVGASRDERLMAQRLLVERGKTDVESELLRGLSMKKGVCQTAIIHTLEGLGLLKKDGPALEAVRKCLTDSDPLVVRHALLALGGTDAIVAKELPRLIASQQSPREQLFTLLAAADSPSDDAIGAAIAKAMPMDAPKTDSALLDAWRFAARRHAVPFLAGLLPQLQFENDPVAASLLPNGSFEEAAGDLPSGGWRAFQWVPSGTPRFTSAIVPEGRTGKALKLTSKEPTDSSVGITVKLEPERRYRLTAFIKTDLKTEGGRGAIINLHGSQSSTKPIEGTCDWTPVSFEFTSPKDGDCQINCTIGAFGKASGSAWFDELRIDRLTKSVYDLPQEAIEIATVAANGPDRDRLKTLLENSNTPAARHLLTVAMNQPTTAPKEAAKLPDHLVAGRDLYMKICVECHQPEGQGVTATFPPLAGSEWVKGDRATMTRIVLGGLTGKVSVAGTTYDSVMPGHFPHTNDELASVINYVRYQFGGLREEPVKASDIQSQRPKIDARKMVPWTVDELKAVH
ncbi:ThuA domain-containing protein [Luteolibacter ambystomatis]|uniref:ThuA domain-containing protein n=1 Tax=Luteolibacter ambystomatis TaxID=2824561 RepID=A0A975PFK3_9BACT|nr:PVC-type heme-binding CxxCH protein [Luteolibacter ambystomatis]QUE52074.1 ThuA domain-containing protein [Luteolibacter ambystomatis]